MAFSGWTAVFSAWTAAFLDWTGVFSAAFLVFLLPFFPYLVVFVTPQVLRARLAPRLDLRGVTATIFSDFKI